MTAQQTIFALLSAILPMLGVALPGIFKQDKLTPQINGLIATVIVVAFSALQAWSEGQLHLINPWIDFGLVLAGIAALLSGPFKPTDLYLQSNIGLGTSKQTSPAPITPAQSQTTDLVTSLIAVLQQHGQAFAALSTFLQGNATPSTVSTPQPVHGPSNVSTTSTAQPATSGVQTVIPAFTATAEIPVVAANATPPTTPTVSTPTTATA